MNFIVVAEVEFGILNQGYVKKDQANIEKAGTTKIANEISEFS